jgi:hypothetical protein
MRVGIIGSQKGIPKPMVFTVADRVLEPGDEVGSGNAPGVDRDAYAFWQADEMQVLGYFTLFLPSGIDMLVKDRSYEPAKNLIYRSPEYFARNGRLAKWAEDLIALIPSHVMRSGTWNTINQFVKMGKSEFFIFNQFGELWHFEEYPTWLKGNMRRYLA